MLFYFGNKGNLGERKIKLGTSTKLFFYCFLSKQGVLKNKWSILYLLLSLSEDPRKQPNKVRGSVFTARRLFKAQCLLLGQLHQILIGIGFHT